MIKKYNLGDEFGYDLAPPFTEEEVTDYERDYDITLHPKFRNYIINISRETIASYPFIITLDQPYHSYIFGDTFDKNNYITFNDYCSTCYWYCRRKRKHPGDATCIPLYDDDGNISPGFISVYFIKTQCCEDTYICVGDNFHGFKCGRGGGDEYFYVENDSEDSRTYDYDGQYNMYEKSEKYKPNC